MTNELNIGLKKEKVITTLYEFDKLSSSEIVNFQLNISSNKKEYLMTIESIYINNEKFADVDVDNGFLFFCNGELDHSDPFFVYEKNKFEYSLSIALYETKEVYSVSVVFKDKTIVHKEISKFHLSKLNALSRRNFDEDSLNVSEIKFYNNLPKKVFIYCKDNNSVVYFQYQKYGIFEESKVILERGVNLIDIPNVFVDHLGIDVSFSGENFDEEHKHIINGFFNTPPSKFFLTNELDLYSGCNNYSDTPYKSMIIDGRKYSKEMEDYIIRNVNNYNSIEIITLSESINLYKFINHYNNVKLTLFYKANGKDYVYDSFIGKNVDFYNFAKTLKLNEEEIDLSNEFSLNNSWLNLRKKKNIHLEYMLSFGISYSLPINKDKHSCLKNYKFEKLKIKENKCTSCEFLLQCRLMTGMPFTLILKDNKCIIEEAFKRNDLF